MNRIHIDDMPIGYTYCEAVCGESTNITEFKHMECNTEFERIVGKSKGEIVGKCLGQVFDYGENISHIISLGIKAINAGENMSVDYHHTKSQIWYKVLVKSLGKDRLALYFIDINDSLEVDRELDLENRRLREIVEGTQTGTWEWDMVSGLNIVNENWAEIIGYRADELNPITHEDWRELIHPDDIEKSDRLIEEHIIGETEYYVSEFRIRHKEGYWIWVLERGKIISYGEDGSPKIMIGTHIDITDRKHKQEEVEYLSYHDQLTGVYNRRYFEEAIRKMDSEENLPISLIVADINGLKLTNDAFGHQVGDSLIRRAAGILKESSREGDIVARIGGDEFVVILPRTDSINASKINSRYYEIISKTELDPVSVSLAMSCATKYDSREDIMDIFREAEQKMYDRKMKESKSVKEDNLESIIEKFFESEGFEKYHSENVARISEAIGNSIGMRRSELEHLKLSSLLHDIGSIGVTKNTFGDVKGTDECEMREMRRHPEVGYQILKSVNRMVPVAEYVLYHHERWDGRGYPSGLKENQIPLHSRIISVVDSYDMLRNYEGKSKEEALEHIEDSSGKRFDPKIVEVFLNEIRHMEI